MMQNPNLQQEVPDADILQNIYLERSGKGSRQLSEALLEQPETPLTPEEAQQAVAFETELCEYLVSEELTLEQLLRKHKGEATQAPTFFADAFLKGQVHVPGLEGRLRQFASPTDVYAWLAEEARATTISLADFSEMARQSAVHYKTEVQQALLRNERPNDSVLDSMPIVVEPEKTLEFAKAAIVARQYLMEKRSEFARNTNDVNGAKRAFVDIYTKKVNSLVAGDVVVLEYLIQQAQLIDDNEGMVDAYLAMPAMLREAATNEDTRHTLNKRLDYLKNGIGYDKDGRPSAVASEIFVTPEAESTQERTPPVFSPEQRDVLRQTMVDKETIHSLFKGVLQDAGMLSTEDEATWAPGRGGRAVDGLYQVVYQPKKTTMAVNGVDGVFMAPNGERSLYDLITTGVHELTHINQAQADEVLGAFFRIGKLKGRRVSMLRETGANLVQRQLERDLFGESKPVAFAYARAIQQLEAGGDVFDATTAFFNEKMASHNSAGASAAASEAADRVLRLMLSDGTNSQPMSYAEENIMNGELADAPQETRQRATLITTLDLDDQLRLHKYGLLPKLSDEEIDWAPILLKRLDPLIKQALNQ